MSPTMAKADIAGLKDCAQSEVFQKRLAKTVKKLEGRLKKYDEASPPRLAIQQQIERYFFIPFLPLQSIGKLWSFAKG